MPIGARRLEAESDHRRRIDPAHEAGGQHGQPLGRELGLGDGLDLGTAGKDARPE
jgi:hypothetical protein